MPACRSRVIANHRVTLRETDHSHLRNGLTTCHPDVLRELLATLIDTLTGAETDAPRGRIRRAQRSATKSRNGYRHRRVATRTGSLSVTIPMLGRKFLLPGVGTGTPKRAERALTAWRPSAMCGGSTRRMERLVRRRGTSLSKSQVSGGRTRHRSRGVPQPAPQRRPRHCVAAHAMTLEVRDAGRIVDVAATIAVGVNAEGYREILGIDVSTTEEGAAG